MVSKRLMGVWAVLDFFLLAAGALTVALSIVWRAPNDMLNLVFTPANLTGGLIIGIMLLVTFVFSLGAIVQRNHITIGLVILNWLLVIDSIAVLVLGTILWYFSLQERVNFGARFAALDADHMVTLQDKFQCCGYLSATDSVTVRAGTFCSSDEFVQVTNNATSNFCVGPVTSAGDVILNNTFTTIYGFMAITISLILASICVINKRNEDERFRKIDAKRGGKGFV